MSTVYSLFINLRIVFIRFETLCSLLNRQQRTYVICDHWPRQLACWLETPCGGITWDEMGDMCIASFKHDDFLRAVFFRKPLIVN